MREIAIVSRYLNVAWHHIRMRDNKSNNARFEEATNRGWINSDLADYSQVCTSGVTKWYAKNNYRRHNISTESHSRSYRCPFCDKWLFLITEPQWPLPQLLQLVESWRSVRYRDSDNDVTLHSKLNTTYSQTSTLTVADACPIRSRTNWRLSSWRTHRSRQQQSAAAGVHLWLDGFTIRRCVRHAVRHTPNLYIMCSSMYILTSGLRARAESHIRTRMTTRTPTLAQHSHPTCIEELRRYILVDTHSCVCTNVFGWHFAIRAWRLTLCM